MKRIENLDIVATRFRRHVLDTAKANGPGAVQLSVFDGSQQFITGYVWASLADKIVQCMAFGPVDLTGATADKPAIIWALPPNPDEPHSLYIMLGPALIQASPASRIPPIKVTSFNDSSGMTLLNWLEL